MVYNTTIDQVGCKERVDRIFSRSIKKESKIWALNTVLSMIDLTTLEGRDSSGKVKQLCYKAAHLHDKHPGLPKVAAICVYPSMVAIAKKSLERTNIKTASVATGFPSGMTNLNSKIAIQPTFSREFYNGDALVRASKASKKISSVGDMGNRNRLKQIISDSWHTELIPASQKLLTELERNAEFFSNLSNSVSYTHLTLPTKA